MILADASLVLLAEENGEGRIVSTDERDFHAYRWKNQHPFRNLLLELLITPAPRPRPFPDSLLHWPPRSGEMQPLNFPLYGPR